MIAVDTYMEEADMSLRVKASGQLNGTTYQDGTDSSTNSSSDSDDEKREKYQRLRDKDMERETGHKPYRRSDVNRHPNNDRDTRQGRRVDYIDDTNYRSHSSSYRAPDENYLWKVIV